MGEDAKLTHTKVQREGDKAFHVSFFQADQGRGSRLVSRNISLGAALARNQVNAVLSGEGADCLMDGLYLAQGRQVVDNHTSIDHAAPHGTSRELYKGILGGMARGVFNGAVSVRAGAQKTDSVQSNKNLLLTNEARVDTKPELRILANDVKCKHGASVGQLSADILFYLRSRGIAGPQAKRLLTLAFASEVVEGVNVEPVREALKEWVASWLPEEGL